MTQAQSVGSLVTTLQANPLVLNYAQNIATAIVSGPDDHCAATLSALLIFVGIYPEGNFSGSGDLEPWVPALVLELQGRRGWAKIGLGSPILPGDVGVVEDGTVHHVYLVIDPTNQAEPLIADNQNPALHPRVVAGDPAQGWSPTNFFLRPPDS